MAGSAEQASADTGHRPVKHVHHGRTPAAWAGSLIALVAIIVGGAGLVAQSRGVTLGWPMFWAGVALLIVSLIVTKVLQVMGHGAY